MQGEVEKGGIIFYPPSIKEGWGGFLLPEFPLFSKERAGGDFNPPSIPLCERGKLEEEVL